MSAHTTTYDTPEKCPICGCCEYERPPIGTHGRPTFYRSETFVQHLKEKHNIELYDFLEKINFEIPKCVCGCGKYTKCRIRAKFIWNKSLHGHSIWNKGLTKDTDERIKKLSLDRMGENNPVYGKPAWNRGLKCDNIHGMLGKHHSEESIRKMSISARNRKINGMLGKHHSEFVKEKLREKAINQMLVGQRGKTSIELKFEEFLIDVGLDYTYQKHIHPFVYDFEVETEFGMILIEVNGDYWHANPEFFKIREKEEILDDVQKRNVLRDKKKIELAYKLTGYLGLVILWENEINNLNFRRLFWKRLVKLYLSKELEKSNV